MSREKGFSLVVAQCEEKNGSEEERKASQEEEDTHTKKTLLAKWGTRRTGPITFPTPITVAVASAAQL